MTVVDYGVDVQRRAYRALNEDGIVDMALGLALLFVALYVGPRHLVRWNMTVWTALAPMLVMLAARGLRRRFVYPRIGYARIRPAGPSIIMMATLNLLLVGGLVVTAIYTGRGTRPPASLFPWLFRALALAGAATLALMGQRTGLTRFYVHAAVILVAALASAAVRNESYGLLMMFGLTGLFLLITGLVCFARFLRRHPKPEATGANP